MAFSIRLSDKENIIEKCLVNRTDPRLHGKALNANRNGQWRCHISDYLLICHINDDDLFSFLIIFGNIEDALDAADLQAATDYKRLTTMFCFLHYG